MPATIESGQRYSRHGKKIVENWEDLPDQEKEVLIPHLLVAIRSWKAWSTDSRSREMWIRDKFESAKVKLNAR